MIKEIVDSLATKIVKECFKGKVPLFVIGAGISTDLEKMEGSKDQGVIGIPSMEKMLDKLYNIYLDIDKANIPAPDIKEIEKRFDILKPQNGKGRKLDRSSVGGILSYFQEKEYSKDAWIEFNTWLLNECVDPSQKIGIRNSPYSKAHKIIAELYESVNAFCLTLNFDGLLYKSLKDKFGKGFAESYFLKDKCERYFTDEHCKLKTYAEIQIRGDIFFVKCDPLWCKDEYYSCGNRSSEPMRIWEGSETPLKCEREKYKKPYISFPGSYEKDKEVREIINIIWKYLAYKVSCIITIGVGGLWDPILIAFLSGLASERDIPFFDVKRSLEKPYIAKEIVKEDNAIILTANQFMDILKESINKSLRNIVKPTKKIQYQYTNDGNDHFWANILKKQVISSFERKLLEHTLVKITERFSQLGLKSKWWGIKEEDRLSHNRLNHAKGVMIIASYLYERACSNSNRQEKEEEKQFLRIGALLHDIGHLPFSHLAEEVFQELNWRPSGYKESFTHDSHTHEKIHELFADNSLNLELVNIGYEVNDLIKLINGEFGVGYLDAIINGPIDADKIDYVYRDAASTNVFPPFINPDIFLNLIGSDIQINHAGLLVLKSNSAKAAFEVLKQRERLYKEFYLHPSIRLLEKATQFIIVTYFVHKFNTIDIFEISGESAMNINKYSGGNIQISDLGPVRIDIASNELKDLVNKFIGEQDIEMKIIEHMKEYLDTRPINPKTKDALNTCLILIKGVNNNIECYNEGSQRKIELDYPYFTAERIGKIKYDAKTVTLRFPNSILLDVLAPVEFYKIAEARKPRLRSDGTFVGVDCIISIELAKMVEEYKKKREMGKVFVYKIGGESEAIHAKNLFDKLQSVEKRTEGIE